MATLAAMFDTREHAETAIERLLSVACDREAITFLPEEELSEIAAGGTYDWRSDKWGLWRALAQFGIGEHDRFAIAEGMNRGGSVILVAAPPALQDRITDILVEAGAIDLDERETRWREAGWLGYDGGGKISIRPPKLEKRKRLVKAF